MLWIFLEDCEKQILRSAQDDSRKVRESREEQTTWVVPIPLLRCSNPSAHGLSFRAERGICFFAVRLASPPSRSEAWRGTGESPL